MRGTVVRGIILDINGHGLFFAFGDPRIALSSGPAWIEDFDPKTTQRYSTSRYTSTWVKDADGEWRVLFDGSGAPWKPATAEEIAKLAAAKVPTCPESP
jgi:hypothetical protein